MKLKYYLIFFLLIISSCKSNKNYFVGDISNIIKDDPNKIYQVTKIVDGDTYKIKIEGKEYSVRLIGIDTPESANNFKARKDAQREEKDIKEIIAMGKAAKNFVKKNLSVGDDIRLELDVQQYDRYNRILAYVYLEDGRMMNEILVKEGYAQTMTIPPNVKYQERFLKAQRYAVKNERGLWAISKSNSMSL